MDGSLQAYLTRRSTKELDAILHYYLREDPWESYANVILLILRILEAREKDADIDITPQEKAIRARFLAAIQLLDRDSNCLFHIE